MAKFDVQSALNSGYSEAEIADYLAKEEKFNLAGAREAGYSDWEILSELTKPTPGAAAAAYGGFRRSLGELGVLAADTLPALAASALLPEEKVRPFVKRQLREAAQTREELEEKYPTVYKSYKDVEGVGSGFGYVSERFGELLPDILPSIVSGGIGLKAGRTLATKAGTELAEQVAGKTERELMEQGLENVTSAELKNIADKAGRRAALKLSDDYARAGVGAGAFLGSYAQNAPEVFENIIEETGEIAPAGALLFGGLSSMLDSYLPAKILGDLGTYGKAKLVSEMLKDSGANPAVWKSVLREGGKAAAGEGVTEAAQEAISVAAEKFYGSNKEFFSPENVDRYLESFFAGAAGGGALGGISGASRGIQEKAAKREAEAEQARIRQELGIIEGETGLEEAAVTTPPPPPPPTPPLGGFDISKADPAKVQEAEKFLQDFQAKALVNDQGQPLSNLDANKRLQKVIRSLGISLKKGDSRKTPDLISLLTTALAGKGVADDTGSQQAATGVGAGIPSGSDQTGTPGGVKPPEDGGVDVSATSTTGTGVGETGQRSSLDNISNDALLQQLKDLEAKQSGTLKIGEDGDIAAQIAAIKAELARRGVQLSDQAVAQAEATEEIFRTEEDLDAKEAKADFAAQRQELINNYETGRQELSKVREGEEEGTRRALPEWGDLSADERMVFEDALGTYGGVLEEGQSINDVINEALEDLFVYRQAKGNQKGQKNTAVGAYEINRRAESRVRDLDLPTWAALPEKAKQAYLDKVYSPNERTRDYPGPSYETQQAGFDAVQEALGPEATTKGRRMAEEVNLAQSDARAKRAAREQMEEDQLSLGAKLPSEIVKAVKAGDITTVLEYLRDNAKGLEDNKVSRAVNKIVAEPLANLLGGNKYNLPAVKLVYDETLPTPAQYDPKTNTILVGPRGLNEVAVLHEAVHAATVRVIYTYLKGNKNLLTKEQREGVEHILRIRNATRKALSSKYKNAYDNIYEFVAYAMTDPKFQQDLRNVKIDPAQRESLVKYTDIPEAEIGTPRPASMWDAMVSAMAAAVGLTNRVARIVKNFLVSYKKSFRTPTPSYQPYKPGQQKRTEDEAREFDELMQAYEDQTGTTPEYGREVTTEGLDLGEAIKERNKARQEFKKISNKYKNQTVEQLNQNEDYVTAKAKLDALERDIAQAKEGEPDLTDKGISYYSEPGYLGNLFLEVTGAFNNILSAPPEGGIPQFGQSPLYIAAPAINDTADSVVSRLQDKLNNQSTGNLSKVGQIIKDLFTDRNKRAGYATYMIQKLQNSKVWFNKLEDLLAKTNRLISVGSLDEINNIATQMERATSLSQSYYNYEIKNLRDEAADIIKRIQKAKNIDEKKLLAELHGYIIGLHDRERRMEKFYRQVDLKSEKDTERVEIYRKLASQEMIALRNTDPNAADLEIAKLRKQLIDLVMNPANRKLPNPNESRNNPDSSDYNALGIDRDVAIELLKRYNTDKNKADIDALFKVLKQIEKKTEKLNRMANYFSPGVENVIKFYGWQNYFPFKGKPDPSGSTAMFDLTGERLSGDYAQGEYAMTGRQSDADNPVLQIMTDATRAAMRAGHRYVPHAMKNLLQQGIVQGSVKPAKTVLFKDRYSVEFDPKDIKKENAFFVYKDDGSIDIYEVNDPDMRRALKGIFKPETPIIDLANNVTSFFGQMHTRYNPAFAPLDFVRNLMTYAGLISAEFGVRAGGDVMSQMAKVLADGGMHKTLKFTMAYNRGDRKTIEALAKADPDGFYNDILKYYDLGGPVAYMQGLTSTQTLEGLSNKINSRGVFGITKEDFANFFDTWVAMFETSSRIAAFRTVRKQLKAENMSDAEADLKAMAFAKDLANFQQVGDMGKTLGALYMFWRPAATGAVRAMQALAPAFDFRSKEEIIKGYMEQTRFGKITPEQAEAAYEKFNKQRMNARYTSYALLGAGFMTYMMAYMLAGDDEEDRNKVAIDDMARWVRFARFNTGIEVGGRDLVFQLPWGFGPGMLASTGAQVASVAMGGQDVMAMASNIMDAGFESFMPLPTSKIDKFANPTAWAVDSMAPSALRPLVEFAMNTDGLGRKIYSDRQSRYADSFLGGDNVPAIYSDAARGAFSIFGGQVDMSPGTLYFFANNYFDGASRMISTTYNLGQIIAGNKDFDPRTDAFFLDSYLKAPSNYDAIQFTKAENRIKDIEKRLKGLEGTPEYGEYIANNPNDPLVVNFYNTTVNGQLRSLREAANQIRRGNLPPNEKQFRLQLLIKQQNQIKSAFNTALTAYLDDFAPFGYED